MRTNNNPDLPYLAIGTVPNYLRAYWPSRIHADRVWYNHLVAEGERFYAPNSHSNDPPHVYEIRNVHNLGDSFELRPCGTSTTPAGEINNSVHENQHTDNICSLAGALEAGELIHLPEGVVREIDETAYLTLGEITIAAPNAGSFDRPLQSLDPPNGPSARDLARFLDPISDQITFFQPYTSKVRSNQGNDIKTGFETVQRFSKWTFEDETIRTWIESTFDSGDRILNATAGKTELTPPPGGEIIRNDIDRERSADTHIDVGEIATEYDAESFDIVIFDPPWSIYQSNLRYNGNHVTKDSSGAADIDLSKLPFDTPNPEEKTQLGHARLAKENIDWVLKPGGLMIQLTFHGTAMPSRLDYDRLERMIFDPIGEGKSVIGSIDQKQSKTNLKSLPPNRKRNPTPQKTLAEICRS